MAERITEDAFWEVAVSFAADDSLLVELQTSIIRNHFLDEELHARLPEYLRGQYGLDDDRIADAYLLCAERTMERLYGNDEA